MGRFTTLEPVPPTEERLPLFICQKDPPQLFWGFKQEDPGPRSLRLTMEVAEYFQIVEVISIKITFDVVRPDLEKNNAPCCEGKKSWRGLSFSCAMNQSNNFVGIVWKHLLKILKFMPSLCPSNSIFAVAKTML